MAEGPSLDPNLKWDRIKSPAKHLKAYQCLVEDGHLSVFVGKEPNEAGMLKWHLSISHRSSALVNRFGHPLPGRLPNWDEIKDARYRFMPDKIWVAQLLGPPEAYINCHPTTMHLHEVDDPKLL